MHHHLRRAAGTAMLAISLLVPAVADAATSSSDASVAELLRSTHERTMPARAAHPRKASRARARAARGRTTCGQSDLPAVSRVTSEHFVVDFTSAPTGLRRDDYVQALEAARSNLVDRYGWVAPPVKRSNPAPGGRYYVRVQTLNSLGNVFTSGSHAGRVGDHPATPWRERQAFATCTVLSSDFTNGGRSSVDASLKRLRSVAVHEFTHALQYGYGATSASRGAESDAMVMLMESTAVVMADDVVPEDRSGQRHLPPKLVDSLMPHSVFDGTSSAEAYRMWFVFRGLVERFGVGRAGGAEQIVQELWESSGGGHDGARFLGALDGALTRHGGSLAGGYHEFAVATWFLRGCAGTWLAAPCLTDAAAYATKLGPRQPHGLLTAAAPLSLQVEGNYALQWIKIADLLTASHVRVSSPGAGTVRVTLACTRAGAPMMHGSRDVGPGQTVDIRVPAGTCDAGSLVAVVTSASRTSDAPETDVSFPFSMQLHRA